MAAIAKDDAGGGLPLPIRCGCLGANWGVPGREGGPAENCANSAEMDCRLPERKEGVNGLAGIGVLGRRGSGLAWEARRSGENGKSDRSSERRRGTGTAGLTVWGVSGVMGVRGPSVGESGKSPEGKFDSRRGISNGLLPRFGRVGRRRGGVDEG